MKKVTLYKNGEPFLEMPYPEHLSEVPLDNYMGFLLHAQHIGDPAINQIAVMCRIVGAFYGIEMEDVIQMEIGNLYDTLSKKEAQNQEHGIRGQLSKLYGHAVNVVGSFEPSYMTTETTFEYKGDDYHIPAIMETALKGEMLLPSLQTIEVVEAAEIQRFTATQLELKGQNPSLVFSMYLRMLAILCRREGEHLPVADGEREKWINDRAGHFSEIDAAQARNIDFFLHSILPYSGSDGIAGGFLTRLSFALVAETSLRSAKRTFGSKSTTKRSSSARAGGI